MYALGALICLAAIMLIPLAGILILMALAALHVVLLYVALPILIVRFLWDLFTNPMSSFGNLIVRARAWGVQRRASVQRLRSVPNPLRWMRRRSAPVEAAPVEE